MLILLAQNWNDMICIRSIDLQTRWLQVNSIRNQVKLENPVVKLDRKLKDLEQIYSSFFEKIGLDRR